MRTHPFVPAALLLLATLLATPAPAFAAEPAPKPNVLLVILEDWGPYLGCYGTEAVQTPNLDRFAAEGRRYTQCYSTAPVCSVARSSLFTGISQYTTRAQQHRTAARDKRALPAGIKTLPEIFRDAGYFTALGCGYSQKIDFNYVFPTQEIFLGTDWNERKPGQPFFAHLTFMDTHRRWKHDPKHPIDPAKVKLPAWYPDTPLTRADWAMGLESAQIDDQKFGELVARLKREGLYENTIIIVTADHGVALPRAKQFLYDEGLHVPLIIRWPASVQPGTVDDHLVSALDIAPTLLALAAQPIPPAIQGENLLSPTHSPRTYVFSGRDRMDDTHDAIRSVRSTQFRYIVNLMPERPYAQFNQYKENEYPGLATLNVLHLEHRLSPVQDAFMQPSKPKEELYDVQADPDEVHNLAADPEHAAVLQQLRTALQKYLAAVGDPGVSDEFRRGGWPATYPTRTLEQWRAIEADWKKFVLENGPVPHISNPPEFAPETPAGEKAGRNGGRGRKAKQL